MVCQHCQKNPASFFYEENINGAVKKYALCPACLKELQNSGEFQDAVSQWYQQSAFPFALTDEGIFTSLFANQPKMMPHEVRCDVCGMRFSDIAKAGRVGCPHCYEAFREELTPTVNAIHGGRTHVGKLPESASESKKAKQKLTQLRKELEEAIKEENYEKAAVLRDQIRTMESGGE
ncbi:MAG: UvrB/UvrC motif-containing protein [Eubacteriales bacterium]